jgi:hypothetical protein
LRSLVTNGTRNSAAVATSVGSTGSPRKSTGPAAPTAALGESGARARGSCVPRGEVVRFRFETGECVGPSVSYPSIFGRALAFFD